MGHTHTHTHTHQTHTHIKRSAPPVCSCPALCLIQAKIRSTMAASNKKADSLVAVIGDEDTVTGFLLAGVGSVKPTQTNFTVVTDDTVVTDLEDAFKEYVYQRPDIAIVLIDKKSANDIRHLLDAYTGA